MLLMGAAIAGLCLSQVLNRQIEEKAVHEKHEQEAARLRSRCAALEETNKALIEALVELHKRKETCEQSH